MTAHGQYENSFYFKEKLFLKPQSEAVSGAAAFETAEYGAFLGLFPSREEVAGACVVQMSAFK